MIMLNTSDREECCTNESKIEPVENAEEVRDEPDLLLIEQECNNPYCQICFGIDGDKE